MQIKKSGSCLIIILLISILGISTINALNTESGIWHPSTNVSVIKQDCPLTLCLFDSNWINTKVTLDQITSLKTAISWTLNYLDYKDDIPIIGGHNASQIWVKIRPSIYNTYLEEMSLLQALKTAWGLCPPNDITNSSYSGPIDKTQAYHYATEVEVTIDGVTASLQDAINGGTFCYNYYWATGSWVDVAGCGTLTHSRTVTCMRNDGTIMADSYCTETKPATSESYFHQCYLHRLNWGNTGCGGISCCCPFGQATIGAYTSSTTCSDYGAHYYAYQDTGCFLFYGSCSWEDWSCY